MNAHLSDEARAAGPLGTLLAHPTRHLLFTGKGGVGKTAVACAAALALADRGRRVLLVSTDRPWSLGPSAAKEKAGARHDVTGAAGLTSVHIDPTDSAREYGEHLLARARRALGLHAVYSLGAQLAEADAAEVATFAELERLLADGATLGAYDHVVFDTAPTGRTLRLLEIPSARAAAPDARTAAGRRATPAPSAPPDREATAELEKQRLLYEAAMHTLRDRAATTICLVARPDPWSLGEAERTWGELRDLGISRGALVVNAILDAEAADPITRALAARGRRAVSSMPEAIASLPRAEVPLLPLGLPGLDALRAIVRPEPPPQGPGAAAADLPPAGLVPFEKLVEELAAPRQGLVLVVGKSGTGKTTIAVRVAVAIAERGSVVHLCTTCRHERLADALELEGAAYSGAAERLHLVRIDAAAETAALGKAALTKAGPARDAASRALLADELLAPQTQEIAVLRAFARAASRAAKAFAVVDTAPAGTTLALLDAASAPDREVSWSLGDVPPEIVRLLPRLRDPAEARVLVVALPETSAVREALRLEEDLTAAGIRPWAWVVNQSLLSFDVRDPALAASREEERRWIDKILGGGRRVAIVPWSVYEGTAR